MKNGTKLIAEERQRQMEVEGWTPKHDDTHKNGEMAMAAVCYASIKEIYVYETREVQVNSSRGAGEAYSYQFREELDYFDPWPWGEEWDKREQHDRLRRLVIAGALIAAEIDRLQREKK